MLTIEQSKESLYFNKKKKKKKNVYITKSGKMTSLIRQTQRGSFQQVWEYHTTHNGMDFPNSILKFFLELCDTSRSMLIDNILEITPQKKVKRFQI